MRLFSLFVASVGIATTLSAQPVEIRLRVVPFDTPTRKSDTNFQLAGTFGFSVDQTLGNYYLFQSINFHRKGWNMAGTDLNDILYTAPVKCSQTRPPFPVLDEGCGDAAGVVWKQPTSAVSRWNYRNKTDGTTAFLGQLPTPSTWPKPWPETGAPEYATTIDAAKINRAIGLGALPNGVPAGGCTRDDGNPNYYATSAANTKVVYANNKWYMAFNEGINNPTVTGGWTSADLFRVGWATSADGQNWTIRQILFRTAIETKYCPGGLVLTQLFLDGGYFYMVLNEIGSDGVIQSEHRILLFRAPIDTNPANLNGFGAWQIAAKHPTLPGQVAWVNTPSGGLLNTSATGASPLNAFAFMAGSPGYLRQTSIARVFNSAAANSPSRMIAVVVKEAVIKSPTLELWSAPDLNSPFTLESAVDTAYLYPRGEFGWEFGFTQHPDNVAATPRLVGTELDFWLNADLWQSGQNPDGHLRNTTLYRTTASLSGGIYSPRGSLRTASGIHYVTFDASSTLNATATTNGLSERWVIVDANGGALTSGDKVYLLARNGRYVTNGSGAVLTASAAFPSTAETFEIQKKNAGSLTIANGDLVALLSPMTGKYVIAAGSGGSTVTCNGADTNGNTRFVYVAN